MGRPACLRWVHNFYPRPPRGGRQIDDCNRCVHLNISIHALREEGDGFTGKAALEWKLFLSTPSARRATSVQVKNLIPITHFYPRPPRGGRLRAAKPQRII